MRSAFGCGFFVCKVMLLSRFNSSLYSVDRVYECPSPHCVTAPEGHAIECGLIWLHADWNTGPANALAPPRLHASEKFLLRLRRSTEQTRASSVPTICLSACLPARLHTRELPSPPTAARQPSR